MPLPAISLSQFNRIATGKYNAGFVDFQTDDQGNLTGELAKVNNHVHATGKNKATLSSARVLEVKEAFIAAMERAMVPEDTIREIRRELGIAKELDATGDTARLGELAAARFKPLSRQQVREILDRYADHGRGFTDESRAAVTDAEAAKALRTANMSAGRKATARSVDGVNAATALEGPGVDFSLTDVMGVLSAGRSLVGLAEARQNRVRGRGTAADDLRGAAVRDLGSGVATLFSEALRLMQADVHESAEFAFLGTTVKLSKAGNGALSATVGEGLAKTTVRLGFDAVALVRRLVGRSVEAQGAIGGAVKEMLNAAYALDVKNGLMSSDRTSLTRNFAALLLEARGRTDLAQGELFNLAEGNYNTGLLVQIAQRSLDGTLGEGNVLDTKQKLDNYYGQMRKDTANLPDDIKQLLEGVANMPFEPAGDGGFIVRAPIVGDIQQNLDAIQPQNGPAPVLPQDLALADVKEFVADLVFSGDTLVSDVVINLPGEQMRRMLLEPKRLAAFTALVRNPDLLDTAAAPEIKDVLKAGINALKEKLDAAFAAAHGGVALAAAAAQPDFPATFAAFLRDTEALKGEVLAEFDQVLDDMATSACVKIQAFVNGVFDIQNAGVNVVKDPYSKMSKEDIKAALDQKSLNDILDAAATSEVPGQVGFFKQVVSTYFTSLDASDKRSCLAAALRYANVYDFGGRQGDALERAERAAINKFTGAILKGAGPLLHKMMQGLPKDVMGPYADALEDMKQHLAPIPRKIVQGYLNKMIADSDGKIKYIELKKSLGAASVGEAFLCEIGTVEREPMTVQLEDYEEIEANGGNPWKTVTDGNGNVVYRDVVEKHTVVVKIMRHDAERRVEKEARIFTAAAEKIPGMAKTWAGQLQQYMTEFDFRTEARNVEAGVKLYDIKDNEDHPLQAIAPHVTTMKLSELVAPSKNVLVVEEMDGDTVDEYFKTTVEEFRAAASGIFQQDPATGRLKWEDAEDPETHETVKRPVLKENIPANAVGAFKFWISNTQDKLTKASDHLRQATKAWFYNAIIGDGKFHGDAHAGNLMVSNYDIGFIDFGNLYTLDKKRGDGVNEQQELLRVILGAAFRDKDVLLKGFDRLMSPEGKERLKKEDVRAKAEAILDSVLSPTRGQFSFNIVYRLQAAIVELQKLGLELPPQINCFILSLMRLANTVTEINTIVNQTNAILKTVNGLEIPAPPDRDELDYVGRLFDAYATSAGRAAAAVRYRKNPDGSFAPVLPGQEGPEDKRCSRYKLLMMSPEFGAPDSRKSAVFKENGDYTNKVLARVNGAADPLAEAEKLAMNLVGNAYADHDGAAAAGAQKAVTALARLRIAFAAAGDDAAKKAAAIRAFAIDFADAQGRVLHAMRQNLLNTANVRETEPPSTFASGITDILFDNFRVVSSALGGDSGAIVSDARRIAVDELHADISENAFTLFAIPTIVNAIQEDAEGAGDDNSYKIDIGI